MREEAVVKGRGGKRRRRENKNRGREGESYEYAEYGGNYVSCSSAASV